MSVMSSPAPSHNTLEEKKGGSHGWWEEVGYGNLFSKTTLFAGVMGANMVINYGRSKAMAMFLEPSGTGVFWLFFSTIMFIQSFTILSLSTSGVRELAEAWGKGDMGKVRQLYTIMQRTLVVLGFVGGLVLFIYAEVISMETFNDASQTTALRCLSGYFIFYGIYIGQESLLQGVKRPGTAALCQLVSNILSAVSTIGFIGIMGRDGIVPSILLYPILAALITRVAVKRVPLPPEKRISWDDTILKSGSMLSLGLVMTLSGAAFTGASWWIRKHVLKVTEEMTPGQGEDMVGFYSAASGVALYATMFIAGALALEFFPRLSALIGQNLKFSRLINKQTEVVIIITGALIMGALVASDWLFVALNSDKFTPAVESFRLFLFAAFIQLIMWPVGLIRYAHKWIKLTFCLELLSCAMNIGLVYYLYPLMGLNGLGLAYIILRGYEYVQNQLLGRFVMGYRMSGRTFAMSMVSIMIFLITLYFIHQGNIPMGVLCLICYLAYLAFELFRIVKSNTMHKSTTVPLQK